MATKSTFGFGSGQSIDVAALRNNASLLRAFLHPIRQNFIKTMDKSKGGECAVAVLHKKYDLEQATTSQHLAGLRKAGLVKVKHHGKQRLYSPNYETLHLLGYYANVSNNGIPYQSGTPIVATNHK